MLTELTRGIFTASLPGDSFRWSLRINDDQIALIDTDGLLIHWCESPPSFDRERLFQIASIMHAIERQYKQLQTT